MGTSHNIWDHNISADSGDNQSAVIAHILPKMFWAVLNNIEKIAWNTVDQVGDLQQQDT